VIIFGSVQFLSKKVIKPNFFLKKNRNRNRVKPTGFGSVSVFLGQKPVQTGLALFSSFGSVFSVFSGFGSVFFPVFCRFRFGLVRFLLIKPKPNQTGWFFQKFNRFNRFFFCSVFSVIFFPVFSV